MSFPSIKIWASLTIAFIVGLACGIYAYTVVNKIEMTQADAIFFGPLLTGVFLIASAYLSYLFAREREQSRIDKERRIKRDSLIASLAGEFINIVSCYIVACEYFDRTMQILVEYEEKVRPIFNSNIEIAKQQISNSHQNIKYPERPTVSANWLPNVTIHLYETVISNMSILDHGLIASVLSAYASIQENNSDKVKSFDLEIVVINKENSKRLLFARASNFICLLETLSNKSDIRIPPDLINRGKSIQEWNERNNS